MGMLCYGDSNTYGYDPRGFFGDRYPKESRWVDILAQRTGWQIQNEGQNGREIPSRPFQYQRAGELLTQTAFLVVEQADRSSTAKITITLPIACTPTHAFLPSL